MILLQAPLSELDGEPIWTNPSPPSAPKKSSRDETLLATASRTRLVFIIEDARSVCCKEYLQENVNISEGDVGILIKVIVNEADLPMVNPSTDLADS